jgi:hypothetical protein
VNNSAYEIVLLRGIPLALLGVENLRRRRQQLLFPTVVLRRLIPSRRLRSDTSTLGCMPANTMGSFSATVHFRH